MKLSLAVPGRTELAGNHTDHQGGRVLAAAVDLYIRAEAETTAEQTAILRSDGFGEMRIDLGDLRPEASRPGTAEALARGTFAYLKQQGYVLGGFRAEITSQIPAGAGLSSSAAFGVLAGRLVSELFNGGEIPPVTQALAAQYGENAHFGKPCGLMDECACALGGVSYLDFRDPTPRVETIESRLFAPQWRLCTVATGGSHRDLTVEYAAIPAEMKAVAAFLGKTRLRDAAEGDFLAAMPEVRRACGDRAALRALHFFEEDRRVPEMADALRRGDAEAYLRLMDASGRSSAEMLQNSFALSDPENQPIPLALALCRRALEGEGAARVHGGGFGGMVQVLTRAERLPALRETLEPVFGQGCLRELRVAVREDAVVY
jgi:galactokinase